VVEASVLLAERGKPETVGRLRTRGSQGPDDSLGHPDHMEHERGAFKVNSPPIRRCGGEIAMFRPGESGAQRRHNRMPEI
jgi:hypothetical protein